MKYKTFSEFKKATMIIVYFSDSMDMDEIDETINDLYELYKGMKYEEPLEFYEFHMPPEEVNRKTHSFWLDPRGVFLCYLHSRVY